MLGNAAMIAVLLTPTASVARHDEHRTDANPFSWLNAVASSSRRRADRNAPPGAAFLRLPLHPTRSGQSIPAEQGRGRPTEMSSASNTILTTVNLACTPTDQFGPKRSTMRVGGGVWDDALSL